MPSAADEPQVDRFSADRPEAPSAGSSADAASGSSGQSDAAEPTYTTEPAAAPDQATQGEAARSEEPHRRRRRRRRRPPRDFDAARAAATAGGPAPESALDENGPSIGPADDRDRRHTTGGDTTVDDKVGGAAEGGAAIPRERAPGDRLPRRRRRRRPPIGALAPTAPGALGSALPSAEPSIVDPGGAGAAPEGGAEAGAPRPTLHLRRPVRGRRQLPRPPGLQRGAAEPAPSGGDAPAGEAAVDAAPAGAPRPEGEFPRRRRRRRPPPRAGEAAGTNEARQADGAPREGGRPPRGRGRDRRPGEQRLQDAPPQPTGEPQDRGAARGSGGRGRDDRGAGGRGPGGQRDGRRGTGRDGPPRRVEQKLYALESMVDRGFEDVPDEAEDSGSRRVHWTIVKRTVADQKSGKPMSASYVLQREGAETEFPNLGAARAAANKTIVHPEKLTMSKAEHVAAKNSK